MLKLMKYEFRKTMFSKLILLVVTAIAEAAYLLGVFFKWEKLGTIGVVGLVLCAMFGIMYIGIESLLVFHRDLNTKQSYMLFLTPTNSFQVLGAKVMENGISIFLSGCFFALLGVIDFSVGILYIGGLAEFLDFVQDALRSVQMSIEIDPQAVVMGIAVVLASWLLMVVTGYLAIILSATVLAGKRISGIASFIIYLLLNGAYGLITDRLVPTMDNWTLQAVVMLVVTFVEIALMYLAAGWIMERKLSV